MEQRWFMFSLARMISAGNIADAIEFVADEYRDIACACESERKASAKKFTMLRQAAMFTVAFAAESCNSDALAVAAEEFKFWDQDAASWAKELIGAF